jgi:hypothetical protein
MHPIARFVALSLMVPALISATVQRGALAAPAPMPGGANQLRGTSGTLASTLFNGKIRIRKMAFREPGPNDHMDQQAGQKAIVFTCIVSNGTKSTRVGYLNAKLVDPDGIVLDSSGGDPEESNYVLPPGGAFRQSFRFIIKDGFTPVKVFVQEQANLNSPVFRINLKSGDISK